MKTILNKIIRLYKFVRSDKLAFNWFKDKMLAIGGSKDFENALTSNLPDLNSNIAPIAASIQKNKNAWNHLMLALEGPPRYMIWCITSKSPYEAWYQMIAQYEPTTTIAYTKLNWQTERSTLKVPLDDLNLWVTKLIQNSNCLHDINANYTRDDN